MLNDTNGALCTLLQHLLQHQFQVLQTLQLVGWRIFILH